MNFVRPLSLFVLFILLLSACGNAAVPAELPAEVLLTEGVNTLVASYFETQTAMAPVPTASLPATNTPFPSPTFQPLLPTTPLVTPTYTFIYYTATSGTLTVTATGTQYTPTVDPKSLAYGCNNLAFITDVNYPSGTVVQPRDNITKTWKVQNTGTCNWQYVFRLTQIGGTDFDAPSVNLGKVVTVNDWANVSINLDVPRKAGTYSAYWRMEDGDGHLFGSTLGITITVRDSAYP
jgi:hypothetical protein